MFCSSVDTKSKESPFRLLRGRKRSRGDLDREVSIAGSYSRSVDFIDTV